MGGLFTFPECLFTFSSSLFTPSLFISLIVCFYLQVIFIHMFNRDKGDERMENRRLVKLHGNKYCN